MISKIRIAHPHKFWMAICGALLVASAIALSTKNGAPLTRNTFINVAQNTLPAVVSISLDRPIDDIDKMQKDRQTELFDRFKDIPGFQDHFRFFLDPDQLKVPEDLGEEDADGKRWLPLTGGSGAIIRDNGYIVTNSHVVAMASEPNPNKLSIKITLADGREFTQAKQQVKIISLDTLRDLAVLKIEAEDLPYLEWGNSNDLEIGEWVLAVGNPLGLEGSASQGIVSQKNREIHKVIFENLLQITAMINPGNSGGALVNLDGELVGINMAIASNTGRWQGVGFAIPSSTAQWVTDSIIEHGKVRQGYIGIGMGQETTDTPLSPRAAQYAGLPKTGGVRVDSVRPGNPAAEAGLQPGDYITEITQGDDTFAISVNADVIKAVASRKIGSKVQVTYYRNGEEQTTTMTIGERPADEELTKILDEADEQKGLIRDLGLQIKPATPPAKGLLVEEIDRTKAAAKAEPFGLAKGDIIMEVDGAAVETVEDFLKALDERGRDGIHKIKFNRKGSEAETYIEFKAQDGNE